MNDGRVIVPQHSDHGFKHKRMMVELWVLSILAMGSNTNRGWEGFIRTILFGGGGCVLEDILYCKLLYSFFVCGWGFIHFFLFGVQFG